VRCSTVIAGLRHYAAVRLESLDFQRLPGTTYGQHIWNMTTPGMKPTQADWNTLVCQLTEMRKALTALRDALVETELALRDYHFTLDSTERRSAVREASRLIGRARS